MWIRVALLCLPFVCCGQDRTPVVFVNGFQPKCPSDGIASTFGQLPSLLGVKTYFFDNCAYGDLPIESLAVAFQQFLASKPDPQLDIVAHSMGGLIVRAYLAGLQPGFTLNPSLNNKVRKVVFIGTPHFGTNAFSLLSALGVQTSEMRIGSALLFILASWNQGTDDLRGVDAISIAGSGGTTHFDDGLVPLSSSSLVFAAPDEKTRVIPYCHTSGLSCQPGSGLIAFVPSTNHPTYQIVSSFLADTSLWKNIGTPPSLEPYLNANGGAYVTYRTAADQLIPLGSVSAISPKNNYGLSSIVSQVYYREWMAAQTYQFAMNGVDGNSIQGSAAIAPGGIRLIQFKTGPIISRVYPAATATNLLSVAPGMFISIYGLSLATTSQTAASLPLPLQLAGTTVFSNGRAVGLQFVSDQQINAVLPTGILGLTTITVQNSLGTHTASLMVEPSVPALFSGNGSGQGIAAALNASTGGVITQNSPAHSGQFVSLFATGLGETVRAGGLDYARLIPVVTIGGINANVLYAGRAPGFVGLDQLNVQVPPGVASSLASVVVSGNNRFSNTVFLPVQ